MDKKGKKKKKKSKQKKRKRNTMHMSNNPGNTASARLKIVNRFHVNLCGPVQVSLVEVNKPVKGEGGSRICKKYIYWSSISAQPTRAYGWLSRMKPLFKFTSMDDGHKEACNRSWGECGDVRKEAWEACMGHQTAAEA